MTSSQLLPTPRGHSDGGAGDSVARGNVPPPRPSPTPYPPTIHINVLRQASACPDQDCCWVWMFAQLCERASVRASNFDRHRHHHLCLLRLIPECAHLFQQLVSPRCFGCRHLPLDAGCRRCFRPPPADANLQLKCPGCRRRR